jgi:hypothetical protein
MGWPRKKKIYIGQNSFSRKGYTHQLSNRDSHCKRYEIKKGKSKAEPSHNPAKLDETMSQLNPGLNKW